ncbi:MAG: hypothetical protein Q8910_00165 [Bacteroidota bacterium]|nr:hypothetical protein [Bacteroidota bacterium]
MIDMIVYDLKYGGLYDKSEKTGQISKVLRCFHTDGSVTFDRFDYADNGDFVRAIAESLETNQCTYYLEDGSRPLKVRDCEKCLNNGMCNHNQKYYN